MEMETPMAQGSPMAMDSPSAILDSTPTMTNDANGTIVDRFAPPVAASFASAPAQGPAPPTAPASSTTYAAARQIPQTPQSLGQHMSQPLSQTQSKPQFIRQPSMPHGKVAIVEPPGSIHRRVSGQGQGFPSPTRNHTIENAKFNEDESRLTHAVQQSVPEAVRSVVRNNWEKALLGSEFHQAFIMNAVIHHAEGTIIRRAIRDFGSKMVSQSKAELVGHFKPQDLDEVADAILDKASDFFLDKALEKRLATIDARSLINALARAERLGYEGNDLNHQSNSSTPAQPQYPPQPQYAPRPQAPQPTPSQPAPSQYVHQQPLQQRPVQTERAPQIQSLQCPLCWRKFTSAAPYDYHVKKQLCTKVPPNSSGFPFSCAHCGAGFITGVGQQYHLANKVCEDHGTAPATPKLPTVPGSPIMISSGNNSPAMPASTPVVRASAYPMSSTSQYKASPYTANSSGTPGALPSSSQVADDPYGHLTQATRGRMDEDLRLAEETYAPRFEEAEQIADPVERKAKLDNLQNSFSTKQSIIRKKYGVRLRQRRTRAEIDAERTRIAAYAGNKRQRVDDGASGKPSYISNQQPLPVVHSPSNHLSVSDMNSSGLGGSSATAAMTDPTQAEGTPSRPAPPRNSLSSYARSGYRVDTHTSRSALQSPEEPTSAESSAKVDQGSKMLSLEGRRGSAAAPVMINDNDEGSTSEDTDSDSDAVIPATLPPGGRTSGAPVKGVVG